MIWVSNSCELGWGIDLSSPPKLSADLSRPYKAHSEPETNQLHSCGRSTPEAHKTMQSLKFHSRHKLKSAMINALYNMFYPHLFFLPLDLWITCLVPRLRPLLVLGWPVRGAERTTWLTVSVAENIRRILSLRLSVSQRQTWIRSQSCTKITLRQSRTVKVSPPACRKKMLRNLLVQQWMIRYSQTAAIHQVYNATFNVVLAVGLTVQSFSSTQLL